MKKYKVFTVRCPFCKSNDTHTTKTDGINLCYDDDDDKRGYVETQHICNKCRKYFFIRTEFEYKITKQEER